MTSTFSTNKNLELPANGDYVNTWNIPVNGDMSIIDAAFGGTTSLNATSGSATLTYTQYRPLIFNVTGAISADVTYTIPSGVGGQWVVNNATTTSNASRVIFASGGGGSNQVAPRGAQVAIACNGTDVWTVSSVGSSVTVTTITSPAATALTIQSAGTTAMTIDTSQNVGIGTTTPGKKLDVANGGADPIVSRFTGGSASALLATTNNGGANNSYIYVGLDSAGSTAGYGSGGQFVSVGTNGTGTTYDLILHQYNAKNIVFATSNTERARIDSSGNLLVGIGTSSPGKKLDVANGGADPIVSRFTGGSASALLAVTNNGGANNSYLEIGLDSSGSTVGYGSGGQFLSTGINGTGTTYDLILHQYNAKNIVFATSNTERARIDSSGNLLVGTTTGGYRLHVNGGGADTVNISNATFSSGGYFIRFGVGSGTGTNVGYISYNGSGVTYSTTSDYRLKHSVTPMTSGLATVAALKPVTYKWNADNSDGEGFIAHELQSVIPFAVTGDKDAVDEEGNIKPQGVDYSKIVVHLVAAIQELEARLAALEAK